MSQDKQTPLVRRTGELREAIGVLHHSKKWLEALRGGETLQKPGQRTLQNQWASFQRAGGNEDAAEAAVRRAAERIQILCKTDVQVVRSTEKEVLEARFEGSPRAIRRNLLAVAMLSIVTSLVGAPTGDVTALGVPVPTGTRFTWILLAIVIYYAAMFWTNAALERARIENKIEELRNELESQQRSVERIEAPSEVASTVRSWQARMKKEIQAASDTLIQSRVRRFLDFTFPWLVAGGACVLAMAAPPRGLWPDAGDQSTVCPDPQVVTKCGLGLPRN
jgi:hypothetical protein